MLASCARARQPLSLNELTLRIELAKSSVFRMLHTLEVSGYIERDPSGRYTVAADLRAWAPASCGPRWSTPRCPPLRDLSREFRETVSLAMRFENRIEVVATIESPQLIRMGNTVGRIVPPHASSLGKAITAFQPEDVRERLIRSYGIHRSPTIRSPTKSSSNANSSACARAATASTRRRASSKAAASACRSSTRHAT